MVQAQSDVGIFGGIRASDGDFDFIKGDLFSALACYFFKLGGFSL